jgi:hypothetical protein
MISASSRAQAVACRSRNPTSVMAARMRASTASVAVTVWVLFY